MANEIQMPALSPTMEKGTLARWLVAPGGAFKAGDMLAEIETDKATMEMEADEDGVLVEILVSEGTADVAVGRILARTAAPGSKVADLAPATVEPVVPAELPSRPQSEISDVAAPLEQMPAQAIEARVVEAISNENASPLVGRIAAARKTPLSSISGSGQGGRITLVDIVPAISAPVVSRRANPAHEESAARAGEPVGPFETVSLSTMRKTIARRLSESKRTIPHFYLTARCNLGPLLAFRKELNESVAGKGGKVSVNDLLIKALACALQRVPDAHVQFAGDAIYRFERVDISVAVAVNGGLVTPVIRDVGNLSPAAIGAQSRTLAGKAREGKLSPADYDGGTATISNLGMYGIDEMFPVINPPQALILGTGAGVEQPWKVNGELSLATIMAATASFDHRAIDGATAAEFMAALREAIEEPILLVA